MFESGPWEWFSLKLSAGSWEMAEGVNHCSASCCSSERWMWWRVRPCSLGVHHLSPAQGSLPPAHLVLHQSVRLLSESHTSLLPHICPAWRNPANLRHLYRVSPAFFLFFFYCWSCHQWIFINMFCCFTISNPGTGWRVHIRSRVDVFNLI